MGNCLQACCSNACVTKYLQEWQRKSFWILFLILVVSAVIIFTIVYAVIASSFPSFYDLYDTSQFFAMGFFALFVTVIIAVYAPFQSQLFPLWYKIGGTGVYLGWSFIVIVLSQSSSGTATNDAWSNLYSSLKHEYISVWTIGYSINTLLFVWLLPYLWGVFGVVWMWQLVEYAAQGSASVGSQWVSGVMGMSVFTVVLVFFMFYGKKSFKTQFPWISAKRTVAVNKDAVWPCEPFLVKCWDEHCKCIDCCEVCARGYVYDEVDLVVEEDT